MICLARCTIAIASTVAVLAAAPPARAMTKAGVTMADTMQVGGRTLQLNGIGLRTFTVFHIRGYVGALYLVTRTTDPETALSEPGPKVLIVQFARSASKQQVHDLYMQSSTEYCAGHTCTDADKTAFLQLLGTVRAVRPGDRTGFIVSDAGVEVLFNDAHQTMIADPAFGRTVLDSDIGTTTPSAQLRDGLLGKPE